MDQIIEIIIGSIQKTQNDICSSYINCFDNKDREKLYRSETDTLVINYRLMRGYFAKIPTPYFNRYHKPFHTGSLRYHNF